LFDSIEAPKLKKYLCWFKRFNCESFGFFENKKKDPQNSSPQKSVRKGDPQNSDPQKLGPQKSGPQKALYQNGSLKI
jgi:hypothetical protein